MSQDGRLFGEIAVERGFVTPEQLESALEQSRAQGAALGEVLVALGLITPPQATAIQKLKDVLELRRRPAADDADLTGQTLGGCLILDRIGVGAMGTTYRAHHLRLDRDVCLKVLHPRLVAIEGNLERFSREARAAAQLDHPAIVSVYDFDASGGWHFIVMQHVPGQNLRQVLDARGALGPRRALWIGARVLEGLAHAHAHGIVHRDIKPANLLITPEPRIKITDFGLVRILSLTTQERISTFGELVGTPQYMAPEQTGADEIDARTDLYSFGISLFELIAGRPPFAGHSTIEVLEKHIMDPLPALTELVPEATPELQGYLETLCAKAPEDRFADAGRALTALQALRRSDGRTTRLLGGGAIGPAADPSRSVAPPAIVTDDALDELKARLRRSQHLVAIEGGVLEDAPGSPAELLDVSFSDLDVASSHLRRARETLARAARDGDADEVVPGLLDELIQGGHVEEVVALDKEIEAALPTSAAAAFYVGLAYERSERLEEARARYALASALAPDHLPARLHHARVLVALKRVDEAVQTLEEAATWHPTSPQLAVRLAEVLYVVKGDAERAVAAYERAIELAPTRWQLRQQLGWILFELGRLAEAESVLEEVTAWEADPAPARELLDRVRGERQRTRDARPGQDEETELGTAGPGAGTRARLDAIRLAEAGARPERALEVAEEGLAARPSSVPLLLAKARAELALGRLSRAVETFGTALSLDPDNADAHQGLLDAQAERKRARKTQRREKEADP